MNEFVCQACEAEYDIIYEIDNDPIYCPFCGELNLPNEEDEEEEDWEFDP